MAVTANDFLTHLNPNQPLVTFFIAGDFYSICLHVSRMADMNLSIHLTYDGHCEAAFAFYQRCLGGTIATMLKYGDSPMAAEVSPEWRHKILHATLIIGESTLAGADVLPEHYARPMGFFALLEVEDPTDAERIFHSLSENGTVQMPIQETFWASRFGVLVDQFGIPWEINCAARIAA